MTVKQLPARVDAECVAGYPLVITFTASSGVTTFSAPVATLLTTGGDAISTDPGVPTASANSAALACAWTAADTAALNTTTKAKTYRYSVAASNDGAGPYAFFAGTLTVHPVGTAGTSTTVAASADVNVGGVAVTATVIAGGGALDAAGLAFSPAGGLSSTNVQAALVELDTEKLSTTAAAAAYAPISGSTNYATPLTGTAGEYWISWGINDSAAVAMSVGLIHYTPIYVPGACDRLVFEVTTAGGAGKVARMALYTRTAGGRPGNKLTQWSADQAVDTIGAKEGTIAYSGTAGWMFAALVTDAASLSVRTHQGHIIGAPGALAAANAMNAPTGAFIEVASGLTLPATATVIGAETNSPKVAVRAA